LGSFWVYLTLGVIVSLMALGGVAVNNALEAVKFKQQDEDKPLLIHMHVTLKIIINNERVTVPKEVGIDPALYKTHVLDKYVPKKLGVYPLHTHDTSGVIHIESTVIRTFTLGQFFDVWGETFSEDCIMNKCNDQLNKVRMYVDGNESFEFGDHIFKDREVITIEYGSPKDQQQV